MYRKEYAQRNAQPAIASPSFKKFATDIHKTQTLCAHSERNRYCDAIPSYPRSYCIISHPRNLYNFPIFIIIVIKQNDGGETTEKKIIGLILTITIITMSVFIGLSIALPTLDQTNVVIALLTQYFSLGTVMIVVAFARNIIGFVTEYVKNEYKETFEDKKLYNTIMYYMGLTSFLSTIPFVLLPQPYGTYVSGAIIVVLTGIDIGKQALKILWNP